MTKVLAKQGNACAICRTVNVVSDRFWHLDHDHRTFAIRGVLCSQCNYMLGNANDKIETLRRGIEYLSSEITYGFVPAGSDLRKK